MNIEYVPSLEVFPTISHRCFEDADLDQVYQDIKDYAAENDVILSDKPFIMLQLIILMVKSMKFMLKLM